MKTTDLFILTASIAAVNQTALCQTDSISMIHQNQVVSQNPTSQNNMFKLFTGGINAIYSNDQARGGIDLTVQTYHYYLVTGKRNRPLDAAALNTSSSNTLLKQDYKGFEFFLINRAALDLDSSKSIANDYISSMQAAPITLRFVKEYFLTKQREITTQSYAPVISIRLTADTRAVPYSSDRSQVNVGASSHFFVTFSTQFTRLEFNQNGKELDRGTMYFQPSIGIAVGSNELMKSVFTDHTNQVLLSTECRLGFHSHEKSVNDCSLLIRYTPSDIIGAKIRAGIILSSFN